MKYHDPNTSKQHRKNANQSLKAKAVVTTARPWPGGDIDQQEEYAPRLSRAELLVLSRRGLWGLLIFLLVGVAAFMAQDFNLYETLPEPVLQILGCPPPAFLTHLAITGYSFTVVVQVLIRMVSGTTPVIKWHHLGCRSVFFLFYLVSNSLPENFLIVIGIGALLYILEQAGIWVYMQKDVRNEGVTH